MMPGGRRRGRCAGVWGILGGVTHLGSQTRSHMWRERPPDARRGQGSIRRRSDTGRGIRLAVTTRGNDGGREQSLVSALSVAAIREPRSGDKNSDQSSPDISDDLFVSTFLIFRLHEEETFDYIFCSLIMSLTQFLCISHSLIVFFGAET